MPAQGLLVRGPPASACCEAGVGHGAGHRYPVHIASLGAFLFGPLSCLGHAALTVGFDFLFKEDVFGITLDLFISLKPQSLLCFGSNI